MAVKPQKIRNRDIGAGIIIIVIGLAFIAGPYLAENGPNAKRNQNRNEEAKPAITIGLMVVGTLIVLYGVKRLRNRKVRFTLSSSGFIAHWENVEFLWNECYDVRLYVETSDGMVSNAIMFVKVDNDGEVEEIPVNVT